MKEDYENVDVGVLGCGEALICLEDDSSSTGGRCVDSVEVHEDLDITENEENCRGYGAICKGSVWDYIYNFRRNKEYTCCESSGTHCQSFLDANGDPIIGFCMY